MFYSAKKKSTDGIVVFLDAFMDLFFCRCDFKMFYKCFMIFGKDWEVLCLFEKELTRKFKLKPYQVLNIVI